MVKIIKTDQDSTSLYLEELDIKKRENAKVYELGELRKQLDCGVYVVEKEQISGVMPKGLNYAHIEAPTNPHLIKGLDIFEHTFCLYKGIDQEEREQYEFCGENMSILYCHGRDGRERNPPINDWMLRTTAEQRFRNKSVLNIVREVLEEENIDIILTCNPGGYPKDVSQYPFLQDIIYGKDTLETWLYTLRDSNGLRMVLDNMYSATNPNNPDLKTTIPRKFLRRRTDAE